ncbi:hypothetical protein CK203_020026 [Vitis vinifera]|uniref:Reverse transcriptase RNase H-like domain-containing protein n=1 Tax=Vitis vinifera TaxID=29760 RepID=A0A438J2S4_VITVI|nr:hypothetical protein CK203_020026 [Vitis vinifera]
MQEVVRGEVLKLLQAGIIYPISDSLWVSPTQVVPKNWNHCIQNEKGEEVSTRPTSGWRVCIDYRRLNSVTRKDHFPLPSWTKSLESLRTSFLLRMPFGLCNALATFQRCMLSIFSDMVERIIEVLLRVLLHLEAVLHRYKAKVELIVKLPPPKMLKELGNPRTCGFYRRVSIVVFTDHSALKYLLTKKDAKARLIRWIILLQEFNLQIRDKKGVENVVADHLSRLVIAHDSHSKRVECQDKRHFFAKIHAYYWEEPFLFKYCADQIIRKCVPEQEQSGFFPIAMIVHVEDAHSMCKGCDRCQRLDFMGPFQCHLDIPTFWWEWIMSLSGFEAIPCRSNDHRVVLKFLKDNIFARFGVPKAIISDGGPLLHKPFETLLAKYGVKHKDSYKTILGMSPYCLVYGKACIFQWRLNTSMVGNQKTQHGFDKSRVEKMFGLE